MQADAADELRALYRAMALEFDEAAHLRVEEHALRKHAPEDLSRAIANWDELKAYFAPYPCLLDMLTEASPRVYDGCGARYSEGEVPRPVGGMRAGGAVLVDDADRAAGAEAAAAAAEEAAVVAAAAAALLAAAEPSSAARRRRRSGPLAARGAARVTAAARSPRVPRRRGRRGVAGGTAPVVGRMEVGGSVAAAFV